MYFRSVYWCWLLTGQSFAMQIFKIRFVLLPAFSSYSQWMRALLPNLPTVQFNQLYCVCCLTSRGCKVDNSGHIVVGWIDRLCLKIEFHWSWLCLELIPGELWVETAPFTFCHSIWVGRSRAGSSNSLLHPGWWASMGGMLCMYHSEPASI